jgi:hypothetical protein
LAPIGIGLASWGITSGRRPYELSKRKDDDTKKQATEDEEWLTKLRLAARSLMSIGNKPFHYHVITSSFLTLNCTSVSFDTEDQNCFICGFNIVTEKYQISRFRRCSAPGKLAVPTRGRQTTPMLKIPNAQNN